MCWMCLSVVKCVFTMQMLCFDMNRHGPTTLGRDGKSRNMWMRSVPRGPTRSSDQEEQGITVDYLSITCVRVIVKSCQAIVAQPACAKLVVI